MREEKKAASAAVAVPVMTRNRTKDDILHFLTKEQMVEEIIRLDAALAAALAAAPTTQEAPQQEPVAWRHSKTLCLYETKAEVPLADGDEWAEPLYLATPQPAPVAQGDALPREDFAWMVVQEACETEPADEDDPECIRILRIDLKSAVLAAFLRLDAARAQAKEGGA